jgi:branched-chain amino acid transport system ATP-binding protein
VTESDPLLSITGATLRFGGVTALSSVSFDVHRGHIVGLIGPNGAGKTSLINVITGSYRANEGTVRLNGKDILSLPPHRRAALGLTRTFQNLALFAGMSVYDNVMVGRHLHISQGMFGSLLPLPGPSKSADERESAAIVTAMLDRLGLGGLSETDVGSLSYGYQKRVELARALVAQPRLLLLDEPFAGMTANESRDLARVVLDLWREQELSILIIEHNMGLIMDIADRVVVLDFGRVVAVGEPHEIMSNPEVIRAYVGGSLSETEESLALQ